MWVLGWWLLPLQVTKAGMLLSLALLVVFILRRAQKWPGFMPIRNMPLMLNSFTLPHISSNNNNSNIHRNNTLCPTLTAPAQAPASSNKALAVQVCLLHRSNSDNSLRRAFWITSSRSENLRHNSNSNRELRRQQRGHQWSPSPDAIGEMPPMLQLKRLCSALGTLPARQGPVLQAMKEATMIPNPCSIAVTDRFMGSVQKASFKPFKALVHCCSMFFLTNIALCCAQIASHSAEINCVSFHQFFIFLLCNLFVFTTKFNNALTHFLRNPIHSFLTLTPPIANDHLFYTQRAILFAPSFFYVQW